MIRPINLRVIPLRGTTVYTPWGPGTFEGVTGSRWVVNLDQPTEIDGKSVQRIGISPDEVSR